MATVPNSTTSSPQSGSHFNYREPRQGERWTVGIAHGVVLVLSLLLIIYISYDTFKGINFLENSRYMTFQFWVCVVFLLDFFIELWVSRNKRSYLKSRWLFFIISIPYLNIIPHTDLPVSHEALFYIRFIPLIRGAYALALVMGAVSKNRAVSLIAQYFSILIALNYILALIFFFEEHGINPNVKTFWDAIYFALMNCTTVGCYFSAVTWPGKVISVILPTAGMLMLPLFTVFVTDNVKKYDLRKKATERLFEARNMIVEQPNAAAQQPESSQEQ